MNSVLNRHNIVLSMVLAMLVILSLWMQFDLLEEPESNSDSAAAANDPDYYVE